ncbi:TatD family hydrolase [Flavobacterium sp. ALJ2]|uniref:TatD family hydrolase n=1 Tax=Flavobacterium sp. ALJ2 TaxID=2786960 RepID=UPI00189F3184|nr:TatD family hydrolase [Flavobacterium sp. ALJ2]MBF7091366.1 TatD family hydrolase [Flavobacterium sp. ALJ2]
MQFINFHTHKSADRQDVLDIVNQYPNEFDESIAFYSIGIHPWYIVKERIEADLEIINQKLIAKNCLALGECGLDKRTEVPFELQAAVFERQLLLAQKHQKPVVVHCVAAFQEVIALKKKLNITVPMIIHGFAKNEQVAKQLLDNGFYLSFGKYLIKNPHLEIVFKSIPNNRFFLETDIIDETIEIVYALAAKYKNITVDELRQVITSNYKTVFNK